MRILFPIFSISLVLCACTRPNPAYLGDEACGVGALTSATFDTFARPDNLDILFVVDGSDDGRRTARRLLADAIVPLRASMQNVDVQAAVLAADASSLTGPVSTRDCDSDGVVTGLDDSLECNIMETTSEQNRPLASVAKFLVNPDESFPREDARLLVVIVSRTDDCSSSSSCRASDLEAPRELVREWSTLRGAPEMIALAVFAGPPSGVADDRPVCSGTAGSVHAANRLYIAATSLGVRGSFASLCSDDLSVPLAAAVQSLLDEPTPVCLPSAALDAVGVEVDGDEVDHDRFTYLGATPDCATGAVALHRSVVDQAQEVEVIYCAE